MWREKGEKERESKCEEGDKETECERERERERDRDREGYKLGLVINNPTQPAEGATPMETTAAFDRGQGSLTSSSL